MDEAKVWEGNGLGSLRQRFPWVAETLILPSAPVIVISSELRDGRDVDRCCTKMNQILQAARDSRSVVENIYLNTGTRLSRHSNIVSRRRGHWFSDMESELRSAFTWKKEFVASYKNQDMALAVGCLSASISAEIVSFAIKYPHAFLVGQLSEAEAVEWLQQSALHIWNNNDVRLQLKFDLQQCLTSFSSNFVSGAIFHGNDDFGGVECFCYGEAFTKRRRV
jgi:hypothetical protein